VGEPRKKLAKGEAKVPNWRDGHSLDDLGTDVRPEVILIDDSRSDFIRPDRTEGFTHPRSYLGSSKQGGCLECWRRKYLTLLQ